MTRRSFFSIAAAAAAAQPAAAPRPNIVLILLDDLGWRDFSIYGHPFHETPEVDRLVREGTRFSAAYAACPVCSPTRASLMTGRYPARLHLTDWIPGRAPGPTKLFAPKFEQQLPKSETTIAEHLAPLGYRTASIGKWHLGGGEFTPYHQGFDINIGGDARGGVRTFFGPFAMPGLEKTTAADYLTDNLTDAAIGFIQQSAAARAPFFLYLAHYTPHLPLSAPPALIDKYLAKPGNPRGRASATYAAMIESFDTGLGRLRRKLAELGLAENTVIMVTSDNGGLRYEGASKQPTTENAPLRAGKGHVYEGGIRVPLIVHWPGVTTRERIEPAPVSSIDLFPTIASIAGAPAPRGVDGISLAPLLNGKPLKREALYWHYPHYSNQGGPPAAAVRAGDWKLIEFYEDGRLELFHLAADPGETRNLVQAEPRRAARLHAMLKQWLTQVNASMPTPNPAYDPSKPSPLTGLEPPTPAEGKSR